MTKTTTKFCETVKNLRIQMRLTLREFCSQIGLDPSNWSKVERGVNPPPGDIETLEKLASFFGLQKEAKSDLIDMAALERKELPADLVENELLHAALPAFFRAARGHTLTPDQLAQFTSDIVRLNQPDQKGS